MIRSNSRLDLVSVKQHRLLEGLAPKDHSLGVATSCHVAPRRRRGTLCSNSTIRLWWQSFCRSCMICMICGVDSHVESSIDVWMKRAENAQPAKNLARSQWPHILRTLTPIGCTNLIPAFSCEMSCSTPLTRAHAYLGGASPALPCNLSSTSICLSSWLAGSVKNCV